MKNKVKIVTIGAGSGYTPELVQGFIDRYDEMPVSELWLVDISEGEHKLKDVTELSKRIVSKSKIPMKIFSTTDRKEALKDANFVLTQFRIGQLDARIKDENIPLKYNILGQETNGPGEIFKAFRTIPVIIDVVHDMEELCPEAWLINFANPAGMLTEAVLNYTNWKKIIGICNGPLNITHKIAEALGVDYTRLFVEYAGLNHLTFAKEIYLDGKEITKEVVEMVANGLNNIDNPDSSPWDEDFLKGLGVIPMSYLQYYWKTDEVVCKEKKKATSEGSRAVVAKKMETELFKIYEDENLEEVPEELKKRGGAGYSEAACGLIYSIYSDKRDIQTVNVANNGAIENMSDNAVVEVNCVITNKGPVPLTIGELPPAINGIIQSMKAYEQVACEAAVTGSYEKAMVAMTINPVVSGDQKAKAILNELLIAHEEYLPQFDLELLKKGAINE